MRQEQGWSLVFPVCFLLASSSCGRGSAMFPHSNIGTSFLWQLLNPVYGCFCNQPHCALSETQSQPATSSGPGPSPSLLPLTRAQRLQHQPSSTISHSSGYQALRFPPPLLRSLSTSHHLGDVSSALQSPSSKLLNLYNLNPSSGKCLLWLLLPWYLNVLLLSFQFFSIKFFNIKFSWWK